MISVYIEPSHVIIRKHRGAPAPGAPMVPTPLGFEFCSIIDEMSMPRMNACPQSKSTFIVCRCVYIGGVPSLCYFNITNLEFRLIIFST